MNTLPKSILITDSDRGEGDGVVMPGDDVDRHRGADVVADSVWHVQDKDAHTGQNQQRPNQPAILSKGRQISGVFIIR